MANTIALVLFLIGFSGMIIILRRKVPLLMELSERGEKVEVRELVLKAVKRITESERVKAFSPDKTLHKALSKTRILALKTENKTGSWLEQIRARSREKKENLSDDYWKQLKKRK